MDEVEVYSQNFQKLYTPKNYKIIQTKSKINDWNWMFCKTTLLHNLHLNKNDIFLFFSYPRMIDKRMFPSFRKQSHVDK
jgi:hypothetical protein